ncbi:MAG: reactive intermediate/imine deaminase [Cryomorphaceae bacterium BACL21 MAG-121220-bin10]|nr:MAG: reactive intermediate/imine deaminase [Cryomorphaceae bacterium BACL21 MAG-121220-bin10]
MKEIIETQLAPAPIGPYSQAVRYNGMLYTSGQIALDPQTGVLNNASVAEETKQVMENLKAVLEAAGLTFEQVIKTSIFITNMDDFGLINSIYSGYFNEASAPARETVQVARLPKDVRVEISMIAGA